MLRSCPGEGQKCDLPRSSQSPTSLGRVEDDRQAGWSAVRAVDHPYESRDAAVRPQITGGARHLLTTSTPTPRGRRFFGLCLDGLDPRLHGLAVHRSTRPPSVDFDVRSAPLLRVIRSPELDLHHRHRQSDRSVYFDKKFSYR